MCGSTVEHQLCRMVWFGGWRQVGACWCVLADLEEVEVGNEHKFSGCFCSWVLGCELDVVLGDCQGDGKFWVWCGVFLVVRVQKLLDGFWVPCFLCSQLALLSIQFDDCDDYCGDDDGERHFDSLGANFAVAVLLHMLGKGSH